MTGEIPESVVAVVAYPTQAVVYLDTIPFPAWNRFPAPPPPPPDVQLSDLYFNILAVTDDPAYARQVEYALNRVLLDESGVT